MCLENSWASEREEEIVHKLIEWEDRVYKAMLDFGFLDNVSYNLLNNSRIAYSQRSMANHDTCGTRG